MGKHRLGRVAKGERGQGSGEDGRRRGLDHLAAVHAHGDAGHRAGLADLEALSGESSQHVPLQSQTRSCSRWRSALCCNHTSVNPAERGEKGFALLARAGRRTPHDTDP